MPGTEQQNKRFFPADAFGHGYAQDCLGQLALDDGTPIACSGTFLFERLDPGTIVVCVKCYTQHEFYEEYVSGPGGRLRYGVVRVLKGEHRRERGEPGILEFVKS